jgi:23S rRNA (adenine-N6)-dimethyltransferase
MNNNVKNAEYSRNEIVNRAALEKLVEQSGIREGDTVWDIGAGRGAISRALLRKGARVVAIEKDAELYRKCRERLIYEDRFELYLDDFLIMDFPPGYKYKVFSNIPFLCTAEMVNRLLFCGNPPDDCYLVLQKEAAERYTGTPRETQASLLIKPFFWTGIIHHFNRKDFFPSPSVDIVLAQFQKRECRLVSEADYGKYREFITYCRNRADKPVKRALAGMLSWEQIKRISRLLNIDYRSGIGELSLTQYLGVFRVINRGG